MKISYLIPGRLDVRGGVKRIAEYATRLAKLGHQVEILCEDKKQPDWLPKQNYNGFTLRSFDGYATMPTDVAIATGGRAGRRLGRMQNAKVKVFSVVMQESRNKPEIKNDRFIDRDRFLGDCYKQNWIYIANSSWLKNLVEAEFGQKCHLIFGGVNHDILKPIDGLRQKGKFTCLVYGRSEGWKGGARSARAAELAGHKIPNLTLMSYGQSKGPITGLPLTHYSTPKQTELARIYSACDVFLQSSRFEGFCNTAFEAMACGTPVITTDINGVEDFCVADKTAIIVPPDNEPAMARAIVRLYSDQNLWNNLRTNGLQMVKAFDWDRQMAALEEILLKALAAKQGA